MKIKNLDCNIFNNYYFKKSKRTTKIGKLVDFLQNISVSHCIVIFRYNDNMSIRNKLDAYLHRFCRNIF